MTVFGLVLACTIKSEAASGVPLVPADLTLCSRLASALDLKQLLNGQMHFSGDGIDSVDWASVTLAGEGPKPSNCSFFEHTLADLDHDGWLDRVVRSRFCMRGRPSESLYVFPSESDVLSRATWQDLGPLHDARYKIERTGGVYILQKHPGGDQPIELREVFSIDVVQVGGKALVVLSAPPFDWVVVGRLRASGVLDDVCYLMREG